MKKLVLKMGALVLFAGILVLVNNCSGEGAGEKSAVRYGGQYYPGEFLMEGHDFFAEFDLPVEHTLFSSGTENNEALISGNIDVNVGSDSKTSALCTALGEEALVIGTVQRGDRYSTMVQKDSPYQNWTDMKGETVGTRFGSGAEFVLRKFFDSRADLSWDDYEWVNLKTEDMIAALDHGQVASFTVWAPTGEIAEAQGIARSIRSFGDIAKTPVSIHTTKSYAENHREELVKFLAAHLRKKQMIEENPEKAARLAAQAAKDRGLSVSAGAFQLIFEKIDFTIDFDESTIREIKKTAAFLKDQGKLDRIPEVSYDRSYLEEAKELVNGE